MVSLTTPVCDFSWKAVDFNLPGVDGKNWTLKDAMGPNGLLVMFICNHCPYVLHILDALLRQVTQFQSRGVAVAAISSNDVDRYPQDGPAAMRVMAEDRGFCFPYLYDASQDAARAYGAACTPDFFLLDASGRLAWSGRFDGSTPGNGWPVSGEDLAAAVAAVLDGRPCDPRPQPSLGCNIKWRNPSG